MPTTAKNLGSKIRDAIQAQTALCASEGLPRFAPHDGVCWACYRQIYQVLDGKSPVTCCPFCARSYCD